MKNTITETKNVKKNEKNCRFFNGLNGEKQALSEMKKVGFSLVKQRYKSKYGEIDLIVEKPNEKLLVFIEVKCRKNIYDYSQVITQKQWHRIYNSAEIFIAENQDKYKDFNIRYDAFICFTNNDNLIHIENIFPTEK